MLEELGKTIKDSIQKDMKEKFGLSESESEQSSKILLDKLREQFSEEGIKGNIGQLKNYLHGLSESGSSLKDKINKETIDDLIQKVGLNKETATKIRELSLEKYTEQLKNAITGLEDKIDLQGIKEKLKPEKLEDNAREALNHLGNLFTKKPE